MVVTTEFRSNRICLLYVILVEEHVQKQCGFLYVL